MVVRQNSVNWSLRKVKLANKVITQNALRILRDKVLFVLSLSSR